MAYNVALFLYRKMGVHAVKGKKLFMIVVKDSKEDFIWWDSSKTQWSFAEEERGQAQLQKQEKVGIYSQGGGQGQWIDNC